MSNTELKRCPCCGGIPVVTEVIMLFSSPGDVNEKIVCTNCGLTMQDSFGKAKDKWNARYNEPTEVNSKVISRDVQGNYVQE